MPTDRDKVLVGGMDGYFAKPLCSGELFAEIERLQSRIAQLMVLT
ncbi:MAG TPA: hypothetical protein VHP35_15410 [Terriglobia bacterium]|jgi:hypothetical protein|nr:hypothetical protein [Terriglobia bacterium]